MSFCPRCGKQVEETALFCSNCGAPLSRQQRTKQSTFSPYNPIRRPLYRSYGDHRARLLKIIDKFRRDGAISPEKAKTIQELGLPPHFQEAMHRRLGQLDIFVEVNGKYYLNEERLKQIREQRAKEEFARDGSSGWNRAGPPTWFLVVGILLMLPAGLIISVLLYYFFGFRRELFSGEFLLIFVSISILLVVARFLFRRARRRCWRERWEELGSQ